MHKLTSLDPSELEATTLVVCRSMVFLSLIELVVFAVVGSVEEGSLLPDDSLVSEAVSLLIEMSHSD